MQGSWLSARAYDIQGYRDKNDMKNFYSNLKVSTVPPVPCHLRFWAQMEPSLYKRRTRSWRVGRAFRWCTKQAIIYQRQGYRSNDASPSERVIWSFSNPGKFQIAIRQPSCGKTSGSDSIPAEISKEGGSKLMGNFLIFIQPIWVKEHLPQDFKYTFIIHIYKRKENGRACDNHSGISLLLISGKIIARVFLNHLNNHLEHRLIPEIECSFRKERGAIYMLFAARQQKDKCQKHNTDLYSTYVDLIQAFYMVSRDGFWRIMAKYGCPEKLITIVRQFNDGMLRILSRS